MQMQGQPLLKASRVSSMLSSPAHCCSSSLRIGLSTRTSTLQCGRRKGRDACHVCTMQHVFGLSSQSALSNNYGDLVVA